MTDNDKLVDGKITTDELDKPIYFYTDVESYEKNPKIADIEGWGEDYKKEIQDFISSTKRSIKDGNKDIIDSGKKSGNNKITIMDSLMCESDDENDPLWNTFKSEAKNSEHNIEVDFGDNQDVEEEPADKDFVEPAPESEDDEIGEDDIELESLEDKNTGKECSNCAEDELEKYLSDVTDGYKLQSGELTTDDEAEANSAKEVLDRHYSSVSVEEDGTEEGQFNITFSIPHIGEALKEADLDSSSGGGNHRKSMAELVKYMEEGFENIYGMTVDEAAEKYGLVDAEDEEEEEPLVASMKRGNGKPITEATNYEDQITSDKNLRGIENKDDTSVLAADGAGVEREANERRENVKKSYADKNKVTDEFVKRNLDSTPYKHVDEKQLKDMKLQ